jgi:hypothetical protein
LGLEPLHAFIGVAQPDFGRGLRLDDPFDLLLRHAELASQLFQPGHLALDFFAPFPKGIEFSRTLQDRSERPQIVRGGFGAGDKRLQRGGNISSAGIDGDHRVVIAAATFQEADHWLLRNCARDRSDHRAGTLAISDPARSEDCG